MVSFKNTIIILTSNLGSSSILMTASLDPDSDSADSRQRIKDSVMAVVRSHFRPEFINRIDDFIIFDMLRLEQIKAIVRLQVRGGGGAGGGGRRPHEVRHLGERGEVVTGRCALDWRRAGGGAGSVGSLWTRRLRCDRGDERGLSSVDMRR